MLRCREWQYMFALMLPASLPAGPVAIEDLFEQPEVAQIKISPTGDYLAIKVFDDEAHSLLFMKRDTAEPVGSLKYPGTNEVGNFYWANRERVVAEIYEVGLWQEAPRYLGELFAINFDGSRPELVFGYRSGEYQTGSVLTKKSSDYAWAEVIDPFPADDREILISSTSMSASHGERSVAVMLDIYSGMEKARKHASTFPGGRFLTDGDGRIRLATGLDEDRTLHVEGLPEGAEEWVQFPGTGFGSNFNPIAIAEDMNSVYVTDNIETDTIGLFKLSLDGLKHKKIYSNDTVDITDVQLSTDGRSVYAMRIDRNYPSYLVFSSAHEEAKVFKSLLETFPGRTVDITSRSDDGRFWVVHTSADVDPGTFYLFDRDANTLRSLSRSLPKIASDELSAVEPIEFETFDGRKITGYFTRAKAAGDATAPMVVLVHGGPRMRDYWRYDPEVQALATHGFSVLQINYRGSEGFGEDFLRAGNLHWGDTVQQDIIAGTRWAVENDMASEGRVCIMGSSFGAYSALQSAILAPGLFACAVANAGIYDLELLYEEGDVEQMYWGDAYLEEVIGRDREKLRAFSPVNAIAALDAPVFIAHGKRDKRAPYEHAQRLRKELDRHDKPYEWFVKGREGHGFYNTENQVEFMKAALAFLEEHLPEPGPE